MQYSIKVSFVLANLFLVRRSDCVPFIVQSLSSNYGLVLGGYGPGYEELRKIEVVRHNKVCPEVISDVPMESGRFLGDVSGMAEFVGNDSVIFCRHSSCWKLNVALNKWRKVGGFQTGRFRAASVSVGEKMIVLGGRDVDGLDIIGFEMYDDKSDTWEPKPEWEMAQGRYSFCTVPVNKTAILIIGGYSQNGALDSVELLDIESGKWEHVESLPEARYGHSCLMMELAGTEGVLVSGGALTGKSVQFFDLESKRWKSLPDLSYSTDGHKMVLVEGIPTVFGWEHIEQYDGHQWRVNPTFKLTHSRSAFTVTTVPGHLVPGCF